MKAKWISYTTPGHDSPWFRAVWEENDMADGVNVEWLEKEAARLHDKAARLQEDFNEMETVANNIRGNLEEREGELRRLVPRLAKRGEEITRLVGENRDLKNENARLCEVVERYQDMHEAALKDILSAASHITGAHVSDEFKDEIDAEVRERPLEERVDRLEELLGE